MRKMSKQIEKIKQAVTNWNYCVKNEHPDQTSIQVPDYVAFIKDGKSKYILFTREELVDGIRNIQAKLKQMSKDDNKKKCSNAIKSVYDKPKPISKIQKQINDLEGMMGTMSEGTEYKEAKMQIDNLRKRLRTRKEK
jgi:peptidoglycan hydrolase CwlO-like protein